MTEKTKFYAARDFRDAGTEQAFERGADLTDEPGLANYVAAGCASDVNPNAPAEAPAAKPSAGKAQPKAD